VLPSGRKGYVVQYRAGRRSRRISLGPSTVLTCEQARNRAIAIVAAARNGEDPAAERDAGRKAITVKELAERFDKGHIAIRVKSSTAKEYRRNLERFILSALGHRHHVGGRGEVPSRPPPHALSGEPLPRSGLEDVHGSSSVSQSGLREGGERSRRRFPRTPPL
jgi:hypothetical protein